MICYAIKNENKYYKKGKNHWTTDIKNCALWGEEHKVYWFISSCCLMSLPNIKVVKVEIREVEDEN